MKTSGYVTVNRRGSMRLTKRPPDLFAGEVAVKLTLNLPDEAFRTPFAEATIEVPEGFIIRPELDAWLEPQP